MFFRSILHDVYRSLNITFLFYYLRYYGLADLGILLMIFCNLDYLIGGIAITFA